MKLPRSGVLERYLPSGAHRGGIVAAMFVDAFGNGMFIPFALVFYVARTHMPLDVIGLALTISAAVALPVGPVVGRLADRSGPLPFLVGSNVLQGLVFLGYLEIRNFWTLAILTALSATFGEAYWTVNSIFIGSISSGADTAKWFAVQRVARNLGLGLGSLAIGLALSDAGSRGTVLVVVVFLNAASYFIAPAFIGWWWRAAGPVSGLHASSDGEPADGAPTAGKSRMTRDPAFWRMCALTFATTIGGLAPFLLWAVFITVQLRLPTWLVACMLALNCGLVVVGQLPLTHWVSRLVIRAQLAGSFVMWTGVFAVFVVAGSLARPVAVTVLIAAAVVYTVAEIVLVPALCAAQVESARGVSMGAYMGAYQASFTMASVVSPALLTTLAGLNERLPWAVLASLGLAAAVLVYQAGEHRAECPGPEAGPAEA